MQVSVTHTTTAPTAPTPESAIAGILAAYRAVADRENEAAAERRKLRKLVDQITVGTYGHWALSPSEPSLILDQDAAKELLTELGREVPMKETQPGVTVTYVGPQQ
jgi:hypothetical protein